MKRGTKRIILVCTLILALVMSCVCMSFGASGTKRSIACDTIKSGKYVYCNTQKGIYRVNIRTGKKKCIYKESSPDIQCPGPMVLYKGYLYFTDGGGIGEPLCRVKTNGKNSKFLAYVYEFAISDGHIYYTASNSDFTKTLKRKMSLNGKNKTKSSYKIDYRYRKTNNKNYYVREKRTGGSRIVYYLAKPGKDIKLCSYVSD